MGAPALDHGAGTLAAESSETRPDEGEWEYEYDDTETEDFFFTLDVTTHQKPKTESPKQKAKRRTSNSIRNGSKRNESASTPNIAGSDPKPSSTNLVQPSSITSEAQEGRLQILDLHEENPLVLLDGQLYSCNWGTDPGSQFYVTHAGVAEKPLRPGRLLDVVGLSRARLIGRPAAVRQREAAAVLDVGASAENAIAIDAENHDDDQDDKIDLTSDTPHEVSLQDAPTPTEHFTRKRRAATDPETKAHASFLERLSAIKEKKGETNHIPLHGVQSYELPSNQDEIRKRAMAADAEMEENATPASTQNGKRGPYKKKPANAAEEAATAPEKKRKKPGPQSNLAITSSLGLAASITPVGSTSLLDPQIDHTSPQRQESSPPNS